MLHASGFEFTGSALLATRFYSPIAAAAADPNDHAMATMAMQAHL